MLPSVGYFSGVPCVYFSDGGCSRPHCHYQHSYQDAVPKTQETRRTSKSNDGGSDQGSWSLEQVTMVTALVENAVDKALQRDPMTPPATRSDLVKSTLDKLLADPEALKMASKRKPSCRVEPAPAYEPTPISKLSTEHTSVSFIPEQLYSRSHYDMSDHITSSKIKAKLINSDLESTAKPLTSNPDKRNSIFQKALNKDRNNTETKLAGSQDTAQTKVTKQCEIPLKRSSESELRKNKDSDDDSSVSKVPSEDKTKPPNKSKLNTNSISSITGLNKFEIDSGTIQATSLNIPRVMKNKENSGGDPAAKEDKGLVSVGKSNVQLDFCKLPAKRKKLASPINLQVSSSVDPFSRWMENKKIRQILGKDKKRKASCKSQTVAEPQAQKKGHTKILSKKVVQLDEELPEPKIFKRTAHQQDQFKPAPILAQDVKIPSAFRQHFCVAFYEELKKSMNLDTAKRKALEEELQVAKNSKTTKTYRNNCSLLVVKYRKGNVEDEKLMQEDFTASSCPDFTYGWSLYKSFCSYLLSESELKENGFPLAVPDRPNCAFVDKSSRRYVIQESEKSFHKICANCSVEFQIDKTGFPTTVDDCFYHWGKLKKIQFKGQMVEKFTCCGGSVGAHPCESSVYHVWSGRAEDCMEGFVETTALPSYMDDHDAGIYALDCEMCYTTDGLELARLTVLDLNGRSAFDEVVALKNPVLNFATRFSGIDARKMAAATHTFDDVRNWVLDHFYDKTILIGHSLENDLKALKLIHRRIVDTSVTFPHKFGPPNKMSLKHLANAVLELNIQENTDGHDSKEDAVTCLKLMMKKIREDSKARKPRIIIGYNGKKK